VIVSGLTDFAAYCVDERCGKAIDGHREKREPSSGASRVCAQRLSRKGYPGSQRIVMTITQAVRKESARLS
jgi:hypothetical protein